MEKLLGFLRIFLFAALLGIGVGWAMPMALHAWEPGECEPEKKCAAGAGDYCKISLTDGCEWNLIGICHTQGQGCDDN